MFIVFFLLSLFTIIALIIGLISPKTIIFWGTNEKKTRKWILLYYGVALIVFFVAFVATAPELSAEEKAAMAIQREVEQTKKEAEKKLKVEEKAKKDAAEKVKVEEKAKKEGDERAKKEAAEKTKIEDAAKKEAEVKAKAEVEAKAQAEAEEKANPEVVKISVERTGGLLTGIGKVEVFVDEKEVMKVKNNQTKSIELSLVPGTHIIQTKGQGDKSDEVKFEVVAGAKNNFNYNTEISNVYGIKLLINPTK